MAVKGTKGKELLRGFGVSPGQVIGIVRIHDGDAEKKKEFKPGEIYVAIKPTPADDPYMKKAAAVITDTGGYTSHAAIKTREWGIPAITGTMEATTVLHDGQMVLVEGMAEKSESGKAIGMVYEWIPEGGEPAAPVKAATPPPKAPSVADMMAKLASQSNIKMDPAFLEKMKKRE